MSTIAGFINGNLETQGSIVNVQVFTGSGTYTPTTGGAGGAGLIIITEILG